MYRVSLEVSDELFLKSLDFLVKTEKIKIDDKKIITESREVSKLRANVNLLLRLLKIYEEFKRFTDKMSDMW